MPLYQSIPLGNCESTCIAHQFSFKKSKPYTKPINFSFSKAPTIFILFFKLPSILVIKKIEKINEKREEYNLKQSEVEIFISDENFYKLRTPLVQEILKYQLEFEKYCLKISKIISEEKDLNVRRKKILEEIKKYGDISLEKLREIRPIRNKLIEYLSEVIKESFKSK